MFFFTTQVSPMAFTCEEPDDKIFKLKTLIRLAASIPMHVEENAVNIDLVMFYGV